MRSSRELGEVAAALGHTRPAVLQTVSRARWFGVCSCGFVSSTTNTQRDAAGALIHHMTLVGRAWERTSLPLPATPPPMPRPWPEVRRRSAHLNAWLTHWEQATDDAPRPTGMPWPDDAFPGVSSKGTRENVAAAV